MFSSTGLVNYRFDAAGKIIDINMFKFDIIADSIEESWFDF